MNARTFDRTSDIGKLSGCNTRNVEYRWSIFSRHLKSIPRGASVLDFGAGSLRETHDLCTRGFAVTAVDRDAADLESYAADYKWTVRPQIVVGTDLTALAGKRFALITAFDVFEHLEDPQGLLGQMREVLTDEGLIFCSVPNRRTLYEIMGRINWKMGVARGRQFTPGVPHLQFKSPQEWRTFFESCGFSVVDHEMAIGFFVNTWAALTDAPELLARKLLRALGRRAAPYHSSFIAGPRVMAVLNAIDGWTRLHPLFGWNLFVLKKAAA